MNAVVQSQQDAAPARAKTTRAPASRQAATPPAPSKSPAPAKPAGRAATPPRRPPPGINGFQAPIGSFKQAMLVTLRSAEAIRLAERGFASAQESLFNIAVVLPRHLQEDLHSIRQTEASLVVLFDQLAADIRADLQRVRKQAKEAGVEIQEGNYTPLVETVDLYTPQAIQLLNIIKDYDEMSCLTFALLFSSQMTNTERVRLYSSWRNRLGKFIRSLKMHYITLRNRGALGPVEEETGDMTEEGLGEELDRLDSALATSPTTQETP